MTARDSRFPSGPWAGFYQQRGDRPTAQDMYFSGGRLTGSGSDRAGAFTLSGHYDPAAGTASWTKTYATHRVSYRGFAERGGLWGTWELDRGRDRGGFQIWPRRRRSGGASRTTRAAVPVAGTGEVNFDDAIDRAADRANELEPVGAG